MSFPEGTTGSSETRSARGRGTLQPWLTAPLMFLGLLFVVLPIVLAVEDAAWALYGFGLFSALVIALLARRWYRVTVIERGSGYRVVRVQSLRGTRASASQDSP